MSITDQAVTLLRESPEYLDDARMGAPLGNSVAGSILSMTTGTPRQYTEQAVCEAVALIEREAGHE